MVCHGKDNPKRCVMKVRSKDEAVGDVDDDEDPQYFQLLLL